MNVIRACVNKTMNAVKMTTAAVSTTEHMSCIPAVGYIWYAPFPTATSVGDRALPHTHTPTHTHTHTWLHLLYVPLTCMTVTTLEYCSCMLSVLDSCGVSVSVRVWYYLCIVGHNEAHSWVHIWNMTSLTRWGLYNVAQREAKWNMAVMTGNINTSSFSSSWHEPIIKDVQAIVSLYQTARLPATT